MARDPNSTYRQRQLRVCAAILTEEADTYPAFPSEAQLDVTQQLIDAIREAIRTYEQAAV